jgi:hypothetical protein
MSKCLLNKNKVNALCYDNFFSIVHLCLIAHFHRKNINPAPFFFFFKKKINKIKTVLHTTDSSFILFI